MADVIISITNFSCTYPNSHRPALCHIHLDIEEGQTVLIAGKSGCGKSTLARCLNGLIPNFYKADLKGQMTVAGFEISGTPVWELSKHVGLVFQDPESQLFTLVVEDEIAFGPENFGLPREDIKKRVDWALEMLDIKGLRSKLVLELSDGQKQRTVVASNVSCMPEILIFDEPSSNLDAHGRRKFLLLLKELKERWKKTVILIEHRLHGLEAYVDAVVLMENGKISATGTPSLLSDVETIRKFGLREFGLNGKTFDYLELPALTDSNCSRGTAPVDAGRPVMIRAEDVSYIYNNGFRLDNVNIAIRKGETVGIIGTNGSGKTTLAKLLVGLLKPASGAVVVGGIDLKKANTADLAHHATLVLQNPDHQLFMSTVIEEVALSPDMTCATDAEKDNAEKILKKIGIHHLSQRHPHSLSQGEKQRVTIAAAMARGPQTLILDEPTSGMDGYHLNLLKTTIRNLKESGVTVIVATHDAELIFDLCDRVIFMENGKTMAIPAEETISFFGEQTCNQSTA